MAGRTGQPDRSSDGARRLARELAELYAVPPDEFVAERRRRASELRRDGEPALATELAAARKPTQAAWLVDALSRAEPGLLAELFDLPDGFAGAYRDGDAARLRALTERRGQLLAELRQRAERTAGEHDQPFSPATADQVTATLAAALADPAVAADIRTGTLTRPVTYSGFGPFAPLDASATTSTSTSHPSTRPRRHLEPAKDPTDTPRRPTVTIDRDENGKTTRDPAGKPAHDTDDKAAREAGKPTREAGGRAPRGAGGKATPGAGGKAARDIDGRAARDADGKGGRGAAATSAVERQRSAVEERRRRAEERQQAAHERQRLRDEAAVRRAEEAHAEAAEYERAGRERLRELDRRLVDLRDELRTTMRERDRAARRHETMTAELEAATRHLANARARLTPEE